jgi:hypothetical protein
MEDQGLVWMALFTLSQESEVASVALGGILTWRKFTANFTKFRIFPEQVIRIK